MKTILLARVCYAESSKKGGGGHMMWGYNHPGMMGGWGLGLGIAGTLFWLVAFVDLILLGIFLWKKIKK